MAAIILKGITWGHSRGITPLLAASQRYSELHPGIIIEWKIRTLQEFADYPIEKLTKDYDLLIIDHPWVGCAAATGTVVPLDQKLSADYIHDQSVNSVGASHHSYYYMNHQWALAIDAATPAASYRADLFKKAGLSIPRDWKELLNLASTNRVAVPAIPIDLLMNFYSFCICHGEEPFSHEDVLVNKTTGIAALQTMFDLYQRIDKKMFDYNPIAVAELMTSGDQYLYCPFAYCYSNYSRDGFASTTLSYSAPVTYNGKPIRTTIGGTGISVSSFTNYMEEAIDFASWVVSPSCQRTIYVQHGGQPGHLSAWKDKTANLLTNGFFESVLPVMENGYMRPRYNGYLHFQDHAGLPLREYMMKGGDPVKVLDAMDEIYQESREIERSTVIV